MTTKWGLLLLASPFKLPDLSPNQSNSMSSPNSGSPPCGTHCPLCKWRQISPNTEPDSVLCMFPIWSSSGNHGHLVESHCLSRLSDRNHSQLESQCQRSSKCHRYPRKTTSRSRLVRWHKSWGLASHRFLLTLVLLTFCVIPGTQCTPNHDAWRQHPSVQPSGTHSSSTNGLLAKKPKHQRITALQAASPTHRSSFTSNYAAQSGLASQRRQTPTDQLANYHPYLNSQLLSIPFSPQHQLLYQHQMLPHHSTYQHLSASTTASHHVPTSGSNHNNKLALESNSLPSASLSANSIRAKGSKWWDIARNPSQSLSLDQVAHMDGRHANAILPASTSVASSSINLPLRKKQRRLVKENPGLLNAIAKAMRLAISECQNQLKDHRWNCPVNDWKKGKNVFGKIIQSGCRETAFVYALTSASVAHSIARACSEGMIDTCTCDYTPQQRLKSGNDWEWGGCSDNIKFGYKYARSFVDAAERGRDQRFVMNLHNNEAGRLHVSNEMTRECKCHGMSGSCTVKTCWMRLASFREIGNNLKEKFDKASRVRVSNDFRGITRNKYKYKKSVQLETYEKGYPIPTSTDLIFFEESPDFCIANSKYGLPGTQGRECNASSISVDSCNLVCCDRGYTTEEVEVTERCNCTFRWCCEVNCSVCKVKKKMHKCK